MTSPQYVVLVPVKPPARGKSRLVGLRRPPPRRWRRRSPSTPSRPPASPSGWPRCSSVTDDAAFAAAPRRPRVRARSPTASPTTSTRRCGRPPPRCTAAGPTASRRPCAPTCRRCGPRSSTPRSPRAAAGDRRSSPTPTASARRLYAAPYDAFDPRFGPGSRPAHLGAGAHEIDGPRSLAAPRRRRPRRPPRGPRGSEWARTPRDRLAVIRARCATNDGTGPPGGGPPAVPLLVRTSWPEPSSAPSWPATFLGGRLLGGGLLRRSSSWPRGRRRRLLGGSLLGRAVFVAVVFLAGAFLAAACRRRLLGGRLLGRRLLRRGAFFAGRLLGRGGLLGCRLRRRGLLAAAWPRPSPCGCGRGSRRPSWHAPRRASAASSRRRRRSSGPGPAVNFGTAVFLALIRSPVCGLRTQRASRTRFSKEPKPVMATFSPLATSRVMVSSTDSSACAACLAVPLETRGECVDELGLVH